MREEKGLGRFAGQYLARKKGKNELPTHREKKRRKRKDESLSGVLNVNMADRRRPRLRVRAGEIIENLDKLDVDKEREVQGFRDSEEQ